jgi:hypothetical protein
MAPPPGFVWYGATADASRLRGIDNSQCLIYSTAGAPVKLPLDPGRGAAMITPDDTGGNRARAIYFLRKSIRFIDVKQLRRRTPRPGHGDMIVVAGIDNNHCRPCQYPRRKFHETDTTIDRSSPT